jgi:hypothetical protein
VEYAVSKNIENSVAHKELLHNYAKKRNYQIMKNIFGKSLIAFVLLTIYSIPSFCAEQWSTTTVGHLDAVTVVNDRQGSMPFAYALVFVNNGTRFIVQLNNNGVDEPSGKYLMAILQQALSSNNEVVLSAIGDWGMTPSAYFGQNIVSPLLKRVEIRKQ